MQLMPLEQQEALVQQLQGGSADLQMQRYVPRSSCRIRDRPRLQSMEFVGGLYQGRGLLSDEAMKDYGNSRMGSESQNEAIESDSLIHTLSNSRLRQAKVRFITASVPI